MYVIETEDLYFSYDGKEYVLGGVDLRIEEGEFVGIVGPNGAGKTTLLKVLLGFLKPSHGKVRLFGVELERFREWHRIGYVPQRLEVERNYPATARELLRCVGKEDKISPIVSYLHMETFLDRSFLELSGGQQRILLLGMALVSEAELLLLDEPTAGLDLHVRMHMMEILRELTENEGKTALMVSHDVGLMLENVSKIVCLDGRIHYTGEPEEALSAIEDVFGLKRGV